MCTRVYLYVCMYISVDVCVCVYVGVRPPGRPVQPLPRFLDNKEAHRSQKKIRIPKTNKQIKQPRAKKGTRTAINKQDNPRFPQSIRFPFPPKPTRSADDDDGDQLCMKTAWSARRQITGNTIYGSQWRD